jgi:hypothetical protein
MTKETDMSSTDSPPYAAARLEEPAAAVAG